MIFNNWYLTIDPNTQQIRNRPPRNKAKDWPMGPLQYCNNYILLNYSSYFKTLYLLMITYSYNWLLPQNKFVYTFFSRKQNREMFGWLGNSGWDILNKDKGSMRRLRNELKVNWMNRHALLCVIHHSEVL